MKHIQNSFLFACLLCTTLNAAAADTDTLWTKPSNRFTAGKAISILEADSVVFLNGQMRVYAPTGMRAYMYSSALNLSAKAAYSDALVFGNPGLILWKPTTSDNNYNNDYTVETNKWTFKNSKESEHFVVFWEKSFGSNPNATSVPSALRVDVDDLLKKAENFYKTNVEKLKMATIGANKSYLDTYKMSIYLLYQTDWLATGSGYDDTVGALWVNPSTCKPVGSTIAHEIGHSFQYQVAADWRKQGLKNHTSRGYRYGYGANGSGGNAFWEQCAQWQSFQDYPGETFGYHISVWKENYHRHLHHEWMRYASYWWQYSLVERFGDEAYGRLWKESYYPEDALDTYKRLFCKNNLDSMWNNYFTDYAVKLPNYQFAAIHKYATTSAKEYSVGLLKSADGYWQVSRASCPETSGVNIIRLNLPKAGTEVKAHFVGLNPGDALLDADPGKIQITDSTYTTVRTYSTAGNAAYRGWRYAFVAIAGDKTYTSEMCKGVEGTASYTVPSGTTALSLVVVGTPTTYNRHAWDSDDRTDAQWPYKVQFEGTNPLGTYDFDPEVEPVDTTISYSVTGKGSSTEYALGNINLDSAGLMEAIAKAFKMQTSEFTSRMKSISAGATATPEEGKISFALKSGSTYTYKYTANSGFWCSAAGAAQAYGSAPVYVEYTASGNTLTYGHLPSKGAGNTYTLRPSFVYMKGGKLYHATIVLTIKIT